jgi:amino acid permease
MKRQDQLKSYNTLADPTLYESDPVDASDAVSPSWREALNPTVEVPEGTIKTSVFTLLSTIIGGGVLSIPFTLAGCGVALGLFLIIFMAMCSAYSANLLVWSAHRSGAESYQDVALRTYGRKCSTFVSVLVLLLVLMASIGYVVLMGDLSTRLFPPLLDCKCTKGDTNGDVQFCQEKNRWLYMMMSVAIIFPVTLVKKISALRATSIISVLSIIFLAGTLAFESINDNVDHSYKNQILVEVDPCIAKHFHDRLKCIKWIEIDFNNLLSIPILACSYMCHFNVLPMHKELKRATRKRMGSVIFWTMGFSCTLYIVVALAGYLDFLSVLLTPLGGNVLNLYLQSDVVVDVGRAGLLGTIIMSFPLLTHPARDLFNELILSKTCWSKESVCRHVSVTCLIVLVALAVACVTPDIVVVWSVLGSTVAILIAYVFPPLMYMKTLDTTRALDPHQTTLLIATPAPNHHVNMARHRSYTEDEEELVQEEQRKSKCLPTMLCVMGLVLCVVCTGASVYNVVCNHLHLCHGANHTAAHGNNGPNHLCQVSNHTNQSTTTFALDLAKSVLGEL